MVELESFDVGYSGEHPTFDGDRPVSLSTNDLLEVGQVMVEFGFFVCT